VSQCQVTLTCRTLINAGDWGLLLLDTQGVMNGLWLVGAFIIYSFQKIKPALQSQKLCGEGKWAPGVCSGQKMVAFCTQVLWMPSQTKWSRFLDEACHGLPLNRRLHSLEPLIANSPSLTSSVGSVDVCLGTVCKGISTLLKLLTCCGFFLGCFFDLSSLLLHTASLGLLFGYDLWRYINPSLT
jgi:hypothetical protein